MCKSTITCKDLFSGIYFFSMQSSDLNCTMKYVIFFKNEVFIFRCKKDISQTFESETFDKRANM